LEVALNPGNGVTAQPSRHPRYRFKTYGFHVAWGLIRFDQNLRY
jgi:hypothetical protein